MGSEQLMEKLMERCLGCCNLLNSNPPGGRHRWPMADDDLLWLCGEQCCEPQPQLKLKHQHHRHHGPWIINHREKAGAVVYRFHLSLMLGLIFFSLLAAVAWMLLLLRSSDGDGDGDVMRELRKICHAELQESCCWCWEPRCDVVSTAQISQVS